MQIYFPKQQRPFFFSMTLTHHTRQREERGGRREEGGGREERGRDGPNFHVKAEPICV